MENKKKLEAIEAEIKQREEIISNAFYELLLPKKCKYCGCYDGIHKSDCRFIIKYTD